jgi:restriction system protein
MDLTYQYPPELFQLLVDTIPRLCKSKKDVLTFFRGAGVSETAVAPLRARLADKTGAPNKFDITRTLLAHVNEKGDAALRERREILKRVVEFEDFSTCWAEDQLKAKGLVGEIRRVIDVKDSFARMNQEREREAQARREVLLAQRREVELQRSARESARKDLFAAFAEQDPQKRGKMVEPALNAVFKAHGVLVRESFRLSDEVSGSTLEQIDGVIELDSHLYFVEVKWLSSAVDVMDVSRHLVRIYHRGSARGLFVSSTEFTEPALATCREALQRTVVALCLLEELVRTLDRDESIASLIRQKVIAAQTDKNPFYRIA